MLYRLEGRTRGCILAAIAFGTFAAPGVVRAQSVSFDPGKGRSGLFDRRFDVSVSERPQPQFDAVPIRFESFDLLSTASGYVTYLDNVFATKRDRIGDAIFTAAATADLRSDWSRNEIRVIASDSLVRYAKQTGEDVNLFAVGGSGRYDIGSDSNLQAGAEYSRNIVPRTSSRSPITVTRRIVYDEADAFVGGTYGARQFRLIANADYRGQRYDNVQVLDPTIIGVDYQDRDIYEGQLRGEYAVSPAIYTFFDLRGNVRRYPEKRRLARDSSGYEATAGVNFELALLFRGEVAIGYLEQKFEQRAYRDYSGIAYHAQLEYFPTRLVTLRANADRVIDDSGLVGVGSFLANTYSLRADYEFKRNILITPEIGFGRDRYEGLDLRYRRTFASLDTKYTLSRAIKVTFQYQYQKRNGVGPIPARDFNVNSAQAGVTYRF